MGLLEIQKHHLDDITPYLDRYKVTNLNPFKINFRCPYCGDSKKSKAKARGWIYDKESQLYFKCFNCQESKTFYTFLQDHFQDEHKKYTKDVAFMKFSKRKEDPVLELEPIVEEKTRITPQFLDGIVKISKLPETHRAKKYVNSRKIPPYAHYRIYYTKNFVKWVQKYLPDELEKVQEHPRLVLPFVDKDGNIFGCSARAFSDKMRYLTFLFDPTTRKIFGLDQVDFSKKYFVVEGAFDSFFLSNSIALAGVGIPLNILDNPDNAVIVYDNEPRNIDVVNQMRKALEDGFSLCIWPENIKSKDINKMVLDGIENVEDVINKNTVKGLSGLLKLKKWRKC